MNKNNLYNIYQLTKRNMLIFFKNKTTIFFSLVAPILILFIYIVFMGDFQVKMIMEQMPNLNLSEKEIASIINAWVISGIIGISTLTVALNSMFITISDREFNIVNDFKASPVKEINLTLSYFISSFLITFTISLIFAIIGTIYLLITAGTVFLFNFINILSLLGILLISSLSAVIILMFITSFLKKTATAASFTGIFTALIGFLVGAYLPSSMLPKGVQYVANTLPGTHATTLFRQLYLSKVLNSQSIANKVPLELITSLKEQYGYNLNFFGISLNTITIIIYLILTTILFFIINLIVNKYRTKHQL